MSSLSNPPLLSAGLGGSPYGAGSEFSLTTDPLLTTDPFFTTDPLLGTGFGTGYGLGFGGLDYGLGLGLGGFDFGLGTDSLFGPALPPEPPTVDSSTLSNIFMEDAGVDQTQISAYNPELEDGKVAALETLNGILSPDSGASPEAVMSATFMKKVLENPAGPIELAPGKTVPVPPGSFEATISLAQSYSGLIDQGISPADAEAVLMIASKGVQEGVAPGDVTEAISKLVEGKDENGQAIQGNRKEEIESRLQSFRRETFVSGQQTVNQAAKNLARSAEDSTMITDLSTQLLGNDFVNQVKALEGGEGVTDVASAIDFIRSSGQDTVPGYITQMLQSENFDAEYAKLTGRNNPEATLRSRASAITAEEQDLLGRVKAQYPDSARSIDSLDSALRVLSTRGGDAALVEEINQLKTQKSNLNAENAALAQLGALKSNYDTVLSEMDSTIQNLQNMEPPATDNIRVLNEIRTRFEQNGTLSPDDAASYAHFRVSGDFSAATDIVQAEPQTQDGRRLLHGITTDFQEGTMQEKQDAVTDLITNFGNGRIHVPHDLEAQQQFFQTLGIEFSGTTPLSDEAFIRRLSQYNVAEHAGDYVEPFAIQAQGLSIAGNGDTSGPDGGTTSTNGPTNGNQGLTDAHGINAEYTNALNDHDPQDVDPSDPLDVAIYEATQNDIQEREEILTLPPEQQQAAFAQRAQRSMEENNIMKAMDTAIAASAAELFQANNDVMVANGYPPLTSLSEGTSSSGVQRAQDATQQKVDALVAEANALAEKLVLAPKNNGSEDFLSDLINGFINTIRDQDFKTRQIILAQLANQMMTNSITSFYKDKQDKNNQYHQEMLTNMSAQFEKNVKQNIESSLVSGDSDAQAVAGVSGRMDSTNVSRAMGVAQMRERTAEMLNQAQQMKPPLITDLQKEQLLNRLFDNDPNNDAMGILALSGLQAIN